MTLTNEQIQAILDGAPDGATHCTDTVPSMNLYAKVEHLGGFYVSLSNRWESYPIYAGIHLLSDLREILTLRQEVERLKAQKTEVAARAVESAVELYTHKWSNDEELNKVGIDILRRGIGYIYPEGLLEYAKQLREGEGDE